ncbi:hypothetical protein QFZ26_002186 [Agromyces ramosus]|uniref:SH3b domain-containing protein n=2 Tax=Agromyces ramosus TaxID=33879 RepID=A0ABU0R973_9MICO|nr:hypothetical protein [Agromyces ramosus]
MMPLAARERDSPARRATVGRDARPPRAPSTLSARMLALQRVAGNRAVASLVQRQVAPPVVAPPVVAPPGVAPATPFRDPATLTTLTLGALDDYARERPDWMTDTKLPEATRTQLMALLRWARGGSPPPLDPCRGFTVSDLIAQTAPARHDLEVFARASQQDDSAVPPDGITDLAEATTLGTTIRELEARLPRADLHRGLGQNDEAKAELAELASSGLAVAMGDYFRRAHAYLEADNGGDSASYRRVHGTVDPLSYLGRVDDVRNFHRFQPALLEQLITNRGDRRRRLPLVVILHTGTDHNAAFHDDSGLTAVVKNPLNLTLMIEGATTIEAAGGRVSALARAYGQGRRIQQVMLAGHGGPTSIDIAGRPDAAQSLDSSGAPGSAGRRRTERFLRQLVAVMVPGPDARIVLNACLTAAEPVSDSLPANPALARAAILHRLTTDPSIATLIRNTAGGRTVEGNVASVGAGTYIDPATGVLHQEITGDEAATSSNPADYVERGHEPEGAARSLVVLWARDPAAATAAIAARRGHGFTSWGDKVITEIFAVFESTSDIAALSRIAERSARGLSEFDNPSHQTPGEIGGLQQDDPSESMLAARVRAFSPDTGKIALDQVRLPKDGSRVATLHTLIGAQTSLDPIRHHLSKPWLAVRIADLLPLAQAPTPTRAHIMIGGATWLHAHTDAFFRANAGAATRLTPPAGSTIDDLTDNDPSERVILEHLGIVRAAPAGGGGGAAGPTVESISRVGRTTDWLNVRSAPDLSAGRIDVLRRGARIDIVGQSGRWYAIFHGNQMLFVVKRYVRLIG